MGEHDDCSSPCCNNSCVMCDVPLQVSATEYSEFFNPQAKCNFFGTCLAQANSGLIECNLMQECGMFTDDNPFISSSNSISPMEISEHLEQLLFHSDTIFNFLSVIFVLKRTKLRS